MDLDLLRTLVLAADAPTLAAAAKKKHVTKSAVSQQLKALEAQLGMPLFERVGRNVRPTPHARALADTLRSAFAAVDDAVEAARDVHGAVRGTVRIGAPRPFTAAVLTPRFAKLLAAHDDLVLDIVFGTPSELEASLVAGDLDLAVLARAAEAASVEATDLFVETFEAVAAPRYLERHGTPKTADDFARHRLVVFARDRPMLASFWRAAFGARTAMRGRVVASVASLDEMRALAESGSGIAVLPDYFVAEALRRGRLVRAFRPRRPARNPIVLAWRRGAAGSARIRAVRDALAGG